MGSESKPRITRVHFTGRAWIDDAEQMGHMDLDGLKCPGCGAPLTVKIQIPLTIDRGDMEEVLDAIWLEMGKVT